MDEQQENEILYAKFKEYFDYANKVVSDFYRRNRDIYHAIGYDEDDLKSYIFIKLFENLKRKDNKAEIKKGWFVALTSSYLKRLIKKSFRKIKNNRGTIKEMSSEKKRLNNRVFLGWILFGDMSIDAISKITKKIAHYDLDVGFFTALEYNIDKFKINDTDKKILKLTIVEGKNPKEVAKTVNISRQYVYKTLRDNKENLKKCIC